MSRLKGADLGVAGPAGSLYNSYKNAWSNVAAYAAGDVVTYQGTTYMAKAAIPGPGFTPPTYIASAQVHARSTNAVIPINTLAGAQVGDLLIVVSGQYGSPATTDLSTVALGAPVATASGAGGSAYPAMVRVFAVTLTQAMLGQQLNFNFSDTHQLQAFVYRTATAAVDVSSVWTGTTNQTSFVLPGLTTTVDADLIFRAVAASRNDPSVGAPITTALGTNELNYNGDYIGVRSGATGQSTAGAVAPLTVALADAGQAGVTVAFKAMVTTVNTFTTSQWNVLAAKGADGATGATGPAGPAGAAGGGYTRTTATVTTPSLANGAVFEGTIPMAAAYRLYHVTSNQAARTRLYTRNDRLVADRARAPGVDPAVNSNSGLMLDFTTTSSLLAADLAPLVDGANLEDAPSVNIPISITNNDVSGPVTVTFTYLRTE